jgi:hypothetical protein
MFSSSQGRSYNECAERYKFVMVCRSLTSGEKNREKVAGLFIHIYQISTGSVVERPQSSVFLSYCTEKYPSIVTSCYFALTNKYWRVMAISKLSRDGVKR